MYPEEKEPERLYFPIKEVADFLDLNVSTIRYWETEFKEIRPRKNGKGDRLFTREQIATVRFIHYLLKEKGYTIDGARRVLTNQNNKNHTIYKQLERLEEIKFFLTELKKNL